MRVFVLNNLTVLTRRKGQSYISVVMSRAEKLLRSKSATIYG